MSAARVRDVLATAAAAGVVGWALEQLVRGGPHYSRAFGGACVPVLPVYALGGAVVALAAPHLAGEPAIVRASVYSSLLTALELAACGVDRATGGCSWSYGASCDAGGDCIDVPHSVAWGVLGLAAEHGARELAK